jgi:DNA helicase-2/ATP-dependent DNA helicase PcrA
MSEEGKLICEKCGAEMVLRNGKYGKFYGCTSFPRCRNTRPSNGNGKPKADPEPEREFTPSPYQEAVFEFIRSGTGHGVVRAGAGCAKTTTIVKGLAFTDPDAAVAFLAFNRAISKTLAERAPSHVHASTFHSLGLGNVTNALGRVKVEPRKVFYIVRDLQDGMSFEEAEAVDANIAAILKLVSLCKATLLEPTTENLDHIVDRWNVETNGDRDLIYQVAALAYAKSVAQTATIDYDDMIHLSATGRVPCQQFDVLFVDETQDLNKAQLEMAVRSVKPGGRIIAVGDENQSIYGFRGADTEAMGRIIERLDATVLPLSITYRCPKSHVELANTLVPELEAAEWAEDGTIESISEYRFLDLVRSGDLVLCRTNAPLVGPAFSLIRRGVKAVILGRDIGSGLIALVKKVQKRNQVRALGDTLEALSDYRRDEMAKLLRAGKEMAAEALDDKVETIIALSDGCYTSSDLERKIDRVFSDEAEGVTFGTVHKTKGGEADRVFILKPELMPHPKAKTGWEMDQEWNIMYVAYTRAKKALFFVGGEPPFVVRPEDEEELEGTEGQDRESYTDDQDRDSYTAGGDDFNERWVEWKDEFARQEAEQEREAFLSDPDHRRGLADVLAEHEIDTLRDGRSSVLELFPREGRFEDNIYRPSARELADALPGWEPRLRDGQLVLSRELAPGHVAVCYTSVRVGEIAGGTGDDSIRVVREDEGRGGRTFYFKNDQNWVTRTVPKDADTPARAAAHLAAKVEAQVEQMTRECPECGKLQVLCRAKERGRDPDRLWWKGTDGCRCKVEGGW